ncbi:MAG TPA: glucans biosynthesis glucosyltransferase MdoH [Opitutaceae bacterium]
MSALARLTHFELRSPSRLTRRRISVVTFVVVVTAAGSFLMGDLLWGMPIAWWAWVVWALFTLLFGLVAFGASQAFFGFLARRRRGNLSAVMRTLPDDPSTVPLAPTAILLPVYNEDPARLFAGLRAIYRSVERTGHIANFDFFILSDSTDPDQWVEEELRWVELSRELGARGRVFYRKRRLNTNKKAGNIGDFLRRWGRRYRYMVVLDADSIMSGDTVVQLVRLMECNPAAGLIQTAPALMRAETLFARVLQFSARLYGPIFLAGLNYWQQGEGNYWGHNAIIRTGAFMEHCALPQLPGREPFGGRILSHDFVEAALLRRAGYEVWLAPDLDGTYEEGPPTLIDFAKRDRRWSQGNMQHVWLLLAKGLHGASRVHLFNGVMAYASSLFWLASLLIGTLVTIGFNSTQLSWLPTPGLAGLAGLGAGSQAALLAGFTAVLLFLPKILALIDLSLDRARAARFGGMRKVISGVGLEIFFSALLAPVLMLFHAKFVVSVVLGKGVRWVAQRRDVSGGPQWREAAATHWGQTLVGVAWVAVLAAFAPALLPWMSPVLAGMVLSIPFSAITASANAGAGARRAGLFRTPEEIEPSPELRDLEESLTREPDASTPGGASVTAAVVDPYVNAVHRCLLRDRPNRAQPIREYFTMTQELMLREGPGAMKPHEIFALLNDADSVDRLHREVWSRPTGELAPVWREELTRHAVQAPG